MSGHKGWLSWLFGARRSWITTAADLQDFLSANASFIAQKTVTEYAQAKAGRMWAQLSTEAPFIEALNRARWESFAAILEDLVVITGGFLRPAVPAAALGPVLEWLFEGGLDLQARPAHRPEGWSDVIARARPRLLAAAQAEPERPYVVARTGGHRMFEALPFHASVRRLDEPMIVNSVAFQLVAFLDRVRREADAGRIAAALAAAPASAAPPMAEAASPAGGG